MKTTMTYAVDILEDEVRKLEKCLSNWDIEQYPEARKERDNRVKSLKMALDCISFVNRGFNPLETGHFDHLKT